MSDQEDPRGTVGGSSDAAFLFVLFTFQFFVTIYGLYTWFKKITGTP